MARGPVCVRSSRAVESNTDCVLAGATKSCHMGWCSSVIYLELIFIVHSLGIWTEIEPSWVGRIHENSSTTWVWWSQGSGIACQQYTVWTIPTASENTLFWYLGPRTEIFARRSYHQKESLPLLNPSSIRLNESSQSKQNKILWRTK